MQPKRAIKDAPPPLHTIAILLILLITFLWTFPSLESIDEAATIETFIRPQFADNGLYFLSKPEGLGWVRLLFSMFIFGVTISKIRGEGITWVVHYLPQSKLRTTPIISVGLATQAPFTCWSWNLLGLSFFLNGLIPLLVAYGKQDTIQNNPWVLRLALLLFETAAPITMLVSFVVRYALWPRVLAHGGDTTGLKRFHTRMQHNVNVILALIEILLLGEIPVRTSDFSVAPLYGCIYVLFTWYMSDKWTPDHGPQFLYFFFDTTLGITTSIALVVLLTVLVGFYTLFSALDRILDSLGGGPLVHIVAVILIASSVCRFRD